MVASPPPAAGYQTARLSPDLLVSPEVPEASFQTAISRLQQGIKTIGYVTTAALDGHPIGPVGAFGNGYNYNVSPLGVSAPSRGSTAASATASTSCRTSTV
jgi:hypothetical protein